MKHVELKEGSASKTTCDQQSTSSISNQTAANYTTLTEDAYVDRFAIDSGYLPSQKSPVDTLSDFHRMDMYTVRGGMNAHNLSCVKDSSVPYQNPLLEHRATHLEQNCDYHKQEARETVAPWEHSDNRPSTPTPKEQVNIQPAPDRMSRRSRIIQKIKTQHRSIAQETAQTKDVQDSESQWRKLRRDARARGHSRLVERPTSILDDADESVINDHDPLYSMTVGTEGSGNIHDTNDLKTNDCTADVTVEELGESKENDDEDRQMPVNKEVHSSFEQSLMQQNNIVPSKPHFNSPSTTSTLNIVKTKETRMEKDCTEKEEKRQEPPNNNGNDEHQEKSSSFQSLMNKWKRIESSR